MGKYKRLKDEHDKLKDNFGKLQRALERNGSISTHKYYSSDSRNYYEGGHNDKIRYAQVDANRALFRVKELAKFFGLKMKHTKLEKWEYVERKNTDE